MELWIWAILTAFFLIVEFISLDLVSIWFAIGAFFGLILSVFNAGAAAEIITAVCVSFILLIFTRQIALKWFNQTKIKTNIDAYIGKEARMLTGSTETENGSLKLNDVVWSAVGKNSALIKTGKLVRITGVEGNKLIVEEVKENKKEKEIK